MNTTYKQHQKLNSGPSDSFARTYFSLCQLYSVPVLTHLINHDNQHLFLDVNKVSKDEEWSPILKALRGNRDLVRICIYSNLMNDQTVLEESGNRFQSKQIVKSIYRILPDLLCGIRDCLLFSKCLNKLEISGISLRESTLKILTKGLMNNDRIKYLSLARCKLGDSGLFILAPSIRTIKTLAVLNLSSCQLSEKGAMIISSFLKSLAVRRQADNWEYSLRISPMDEDTPNLKKNAPKPLKRLILCANEFGDQGCLPLLDLLNEEVGLKGLDLQLNQLTNETAKRAIDMMKNNNEIILLDFRNNHIDQVHLNHIGTMLEINQKRQVQKEDKDLLWLDSKNPLAYTFYPEVNNSRPLTHTKSSIKKMNVAKNESINSKKGFTLTKQSSLKKDAKLPLKHTVFYENISTTSSMLKKPKLDSRRNEGSTNIQNTLKAHSRNTKSTISHRIPMVKPTTSTVQMQSNQPKNSQQISLSKTEIEIIDLLNKTQKLNVDLKQKNIKKEDNSLNLKTPKPILKTRLMNKVVETQRQLIEKQAASQKKIASPSKSQNATLVKSDMIPSVNDKHPEKEEVGYLKKRIHDLEEMVIRLIRQQVPDKPSMSPGTKENNPMNSVPLTISKESTINVKQLVDKVISYPNSDHAMHQRNHKPSQNTTDSQNYGDVIEENNAQSSKLNHYNPIAPESQQNIKPSPRISKLKQPISEDTDYLNTVNSIVKIEGKATPVTGHTNSLEKLIALLDSSLQGFTKVVDRLENEE
ncbi:hypothetical protein BC833DRAFT_180381 [Globomyces pollinis-pini]|nr:hypothetical protein BC833DRAFT_180381 [Globomyces pollinis-pini]